MTTSISDSGIQFANTNLLNLTGAMPTTGSFATGDVVLESTSNNRISGWKRLTTGAGNVLNTDWVYFAVSPVTYTTQTTPLPASTAALSATHGLGVTPTDAVLELVCLTAEGGFSIGDIYPNPQMSSGTYITCLPVWKSTTQVGQWSTAFATGWGLFNKTTGASFTPTAANWAYRFKVRAY